MALMGKNRMMFPGVKTSQRQWHTGKIDGPALRRSAETKLGVALAPSVFVGSIRQGHVERSGMIEIAAQSSASLGVENAATVFIAECFDHLGAAAAKESGHACVAR